ncbi:hypothetical protein [Streptomyces sp. NPDC018321]|uniref:hypothetical protein n=1 Tax=unclassified Streptomyces TaxID=2593676 RepID=UPI00379FCC27
MHGVDQISVEELPDDGDSAAESDVLAVLAFAGWFLSQRAQPGLFPETSPCHGIRATPVSQYFPADAFCRHADGEMRTVNGPDAKFVFWAAVGITVAMPITAVRARRQAVRRSVPIVTRRKTPAEPRKGA